MKRNTESLRVMQERNKQPQSEDWNTESCPIKPRNDAIKSFSVEAKSGKKSKKRRIEKKSQKIDRINERNVQEEQSMPKRKKASGKTETTLDMITEEEDEDEPPVVYKSKAEKGNNEILSQKSGKEGDEGEEKKCVSQRTIIKPKRLSTRPTKPPFTWIVQIGLILLVVQISAAWENLAVNVTLKTTEAEYGKNMSILCITQDLCTVNSWSVKSQNGAYETVSRESTSFDPTKYGAQLNHEKNATNYELIVYHLVKDDLSNDYRCECDTSPGYLMNIIDQIMVINDTKSNQDSPLDERSKITYVIGVIGIGVLLIILLSAIYQVRKWVVIIQKKHEDKLNGNTRLSLSKEEENMI
ncbi:uncharacterized protein [Mytilus edulis]|uniref:uncharacterized protein n=1 Tax=Mytilus edulis TaxID=6550 RepID=UPI0039F0AFAC